MKHDNGQSGWTSAIFEAPKLGWKINNAAAALMRRSAVRVIIAVVLVAAAAQAAVLVLVIDTLRRHGWQWRRPFRHRSPPVLRRGGDGLGSGTVGEPDLRR